MISINKLGKSLLAALLLTGAATIVSCGSDDSDDGPKLGELKAIFSSDNFSVEAGGTVSLPFTVTGVEGSTLALSASASKGFSRSALQHGCRDERHYRRQLFGVGRVYRSGDYRW